jgi:anti-anti-sigma regulatory factor
MNPGSEILVSCADRIVWVRVEGNGSSRNSTALRDFAKEMIHRGAREFIVDLRNCPMMNSTFMGTLAAISLWLGELGEGGLSVVNLNERNAESLDPCSYSGQLMATRTGEHLPRFTKPEHVPSFYNYSKEALELMREQALGLVNLETAWREHLQDDHVDRKETKWRPFLQYPQCREAGRRISDSRSSGSNFRKVVHQRRPKRACRVVRRSALRPN